jgi:hypothetical protein
MWLSTMVPLLVAVTAAHLAWRHATRLDRSSVPGGWRSRDERCSRSVALGALLSACAAVALLQVVLMTGLG